MLVLGLMCNFLNVLCLDTWLVVRMDYKIGVGFEKVKDGALFPPQTPLRCWSHNKGCTLRRKLDQNGALVGSVHYFL